MELPVSDRKLIQELSNQGYAIIPVEYQKAIREALIAITKLSGNTDIHNQVRIIDDLIDGVENERRA